MSDVYFHLWISDSLSQDCGHIFIKVDKSFEKIVDDLYRDYDCDHCGCHEFIDMLKERQIPFEDIEYSVLWFQHFRNEEES